MRSRTRYSGKRIPSLLLVFALGLGGLVASVPATAATTPPSEEDIQDAKDAEGDAKNAVEAAEKKLDDLKQKLDELHIQSAQAVEAFNAAQIALEGAESALASAEKRSKKADMAARDARATLARLATGAYQNGGELGAMTKVLGADDERALYNGMAALSNIMDANAHAYEDARKTVKKAEEAAVAAEEAAEAERSSTQEARVASEAAEQALAAEQEQYTALEDQREKALEELADAKGTTVELERQRQEYLEEQERRKREREEREREEKEQQSPSPTQEPEPEPTSEPEPEPEPDPAPSGAYAAVDYAHAQLGKPYEWAADGPDTFDCSGLTMRAWEAGGVSLSHQSGLQAEETTRVSYSDIAPGDLIFWSDDATTSGVFHVGIYIGDDKMIHAPRTGENVQIEDVFYWETPDFYGRVTS